MKKSKVKKGCGSKVGHKTKDEAYAEIRAILKRNFLFHRIHPYRCRYCGKWHVGRTNEILYHRFDELKKENK